MYFWNIHIKSNWRVKGPFVAYHATKGPLTLQFGYRFLNLEKKNQFKLVEVKCMTWSHIMYTKRNKSVPNNWNCAQFHDKIPLVDVFANDISAMLNVISDQSHPLSKAFPQQSVPRAKLLNMNVVFNKSALFKWFRQIGLVANMCYNQSRLTVLPLSFSHLFALLFPNTKCQS